MIVEQVKAISLEIRTCPVTVEEKVGVAKADEKASSKSNDK